MSQTIHIRGARTHNLQGIDLDLPRDRLIVVTGLSGSGKSSLAFDTIYAEGQRRYVESLSAYARQFLSVMEKPDVDHIEGLSPAISIEQKSTSHNPRSTVGTVTEIYDYLRLLFARAGMPRCPDHGLDLTAQTVSQMVDQVLALPEGTARAAARAGRAGAQGRARAGRSSSCAQGFVRARIDGKMVELDELPKLDPAEAALDRRGRRPPARCAPDAGAAARGIVRDGAAALGEGVGARRVPRRADSAMSWCSRTASPARSAATASPSSSRGCSRSTTRPAPARRCDGLGVQQFFDPTRVVVNPQLSLAGGAMRGWDRRNAYYFQLIQSLARALPLRHRDAVERAAGSACATCCSRAAATRRSQFRYFDARGGTSKRSHTLEGILPNLERRYRETESTRRARGAREVPRHAPCPECGGSRLNVAARNVFVGGHTLPPIGSPAGAPARSRSSAS